ncbi:haloacid dehalogenase type II [Allobranchiibius sp. CTAmp26]|uniref:haloacid dehalogenase type II n=1 Tax=Allobranchiibius sp. CTAmp26 TaxID=2815214 RepID=UPI001AA10DFF|nr:haloacid dehalogenase type II [Allobranchiibius sp. CTAmp26]MBO1754757.1 haloacid dehalogenase type II [Allobranchiibius sp. CTAmp26]
MEAMQNAPFVPEQIEAIIFDVIGTLVDEDTAWASVAEKVAAQAGLDMPNDLHQLWVTFLEQRMNAVIDGASPWEPHSELVSGAARDAVTSLGGTMSVEASNLVSFLDRAYTAWPDVADGTAMLRHHRLLAGVSNGDLDSLMWLANANSISWDIALSTGSAQTFKPAPAAYQYTIDTLGINPASTLFVAAHPWDLRAAAQHGFRTAYIARPGADRPSDDDRFDLSSENLLALTELLSAD